MKLNFLNKNFFVKQINDIKKYGIKELFRKFYLIILLPRHLIVFIMVIVAILPCLIIRLISPWVLIRIEQFPSSNFGDFILSPAFYYCKKNLKIDQPKKRCIDFLYIPTYPKVCNTQLEKMWGRKLNISSPYLLDPLYRANKLIPGFKKHKIDIISEVPGRDVDNLFKKCQPVLSFTNEEEIYGKNILNSFGLKEGDKFVCLAVRDKAYDEMRIASRYKDWSYHKYRNNNIDNYILAAEELARRGYFVFRTGVIAEKSFKSENPKVIDYANSTLRDDFMDIYLGAKCSFSISTMFGGQALFEIFNKPCAQVSFPLAATHTHCEKNYVLTKHHVLKKEKRKMSLSEIFSCGAAFAHDADFYKEKGIDLIENTPEEIRDLVIELAESFETNKDQTPEEQELQKTFKNLFTTNYELPNLKKELDHYWSYPKIHGEIKINYGTKFLKENKDWLK